MPNTNMPPSPWPSNKAASLFSETHDLMTDEEIAEVYREPDGRKLTRTAIQRSRLLAEDKLRQGLRSFLADIT